MNKSLDGFVANRHPVFGATNFGVRFLINERSATFRA